jgi:hypothetical protein
MGTTTTSTELFRNLHSGAASLIVDTVNGAIRAGKTVTVNGRTVKALSRNGMVAAIHWQNGSISISVEPRSAGAQLGKIWVKVGGAAVVQITEDLGEPVVSERAAARAAWHAARDRATAARIELDRAEAELAAAFAAFSATCGVSLD